MRALKLIAQAPMTKIFQWKGWINGHFSSFCVPNKPNIEKEIVQIIELDNEKTLIDAVNFDYDKDYEDRAGNGSNLENGNLLSERFRSGP